MIRTTLACFVMSVAFSPALLGQEDPFASGVRPTDPLTPEQEQKTFTVPEGFEVQLFAAEPEIQKPMNLAFDARGRLWASMSIEYPYAAPLDQPGKDVIKILEDTDGDGSADKITTFADGLNIPIGLYPYKNGVIAWSIPNIWFLEDTNGDDVCDKRTILYGPMGFERDTHGMNNGFTRGFDGWLHACHGFNNHTTVKGADGHEITMQSGNTYRMRLHGERIEQFTWGQVNPFGMTVDEFGNFFTSDCHSKPIYQLVHGGYYPSFGKPHDGLGFVPQMMDHSHGSTAIAGVAIVSGDGFPKELRGNAFTGNVMTSRINQDRLERNGASVKAVEVPDFLSTTDPWYRPVDIQYGPDDAFYVADFYNRIIGHYEVPLTHPGRDRTSGRIWRIAYKGNDAKGSAAKLPDISKLSVAQLFDELKSPNLTRRMLATDRLSDYFGDECADACQQAMVTSESATVRAHAMWVLFRLSKLKSNDLSKLTQDSDPFVRLHAFRALAETNDSQAVAEARIAAGLNDTDAKVRYAAVEASGRHPRTGSLAALMSLIETSNDDVILRHAAWIALKQHLQQPTIMATLNPAELKGDDSEKIAQCCLAVATPESAEFLLKWIDSPNSSTIDRQAIMRHIAANIPASKTLAAIEQIRAQAQGDLDFQEQQIRAIEEGLARRNQPIPDELRTWALNVCRDLFFAVDDEPPAWTNHPLPGASNASNPWDSQTRPCTDGQDAALISSHPLGEQLTGILRSPAFSAPEMFRFYGCGHSGFPAQPAHELNWYRLRDAKTGELLKEEKPPRNDTAKLYEWDLKNLAGREVVFEIVDGDTANAYAWLAAGRFSPPVIKAPVSQRHRERQLIAAVDIVRRYRVKPAVGRLCDELAIDAWSVEAHAAIASALVEINNYPLIEAIAFLAGDANVPGDLRHEIRHSVIGNPEPLFSEHWIGVGFSKIAGRQQLQLALILANSKFGAESLLKLIAEGKAPGRLLQSPVILQALKTSNIPNWEAKVAELTKNLPSASAELRELIQERLKAFPTADTLPDRGKAVFEKNCKACHQIAGEGNLVGPQLDGIGTRGLERLLEDTLDPNQNVDVAFHSMVVVLDDGKVINGLFRRDDGELWVMVDQKGKEFTIPKSKIEESNKSPLSIMPENVARELPPNEFLDLMKFLLQQTTKRPAATEPPQ